MSEQQTRRKRRFPVLAPKAEDRPPGTDGVVVDPFDFALLPIVELKLLPDVPAFRDEATSMKAMTSAALIRASP